MTYYLIKRLGVAAITVVIAVSLLYGMIHAVPGDPLSVVLGPRATPEMKAALNKRMGLDKPFVIQLGTFFINVLQGDLGTDVFTDTSVSEIFFGQLPFTVNLIFLAIGWSALLGIPLGCYSAVRRNTLIDKLTGVFSVGTIAIPSFVVALYSLLIFVLVLILKRFYHYQLVQFLV